MGISYVVVKDKEYIYNREKLYVDSSLILPRTSIYRKGYKVL